MVIVILVVSMAVTLILGFLGFSINKRLNNLKKKRTFLKIEKIRKETGENAKKILEAENAPDVPIDGMFVSKKRAGKFSSKSRRIKSRD